MTERYEEATLYLRLPAPLMELLLDAVAGDQRDIAQATLADLRVQTTLAHRHPTVHRCYADIAMLRWTALLDAVPAGHVLKGLARHINTEIRALPPGGTQVLGLLVDNPPRGDTHVASGPEKA